MVRIFDTTLRDGEQSPGCSMNLNEKLQMAWQLEKLNVDIIEAGFAVASEGDFESVQKIAASMKHVVVASLARAVDKDIKIAWQAVKQAKYPRIHTFIATSPIHMTYKLKMTPNETLKQAVAAVTYAKSFCHDVEFSAEDATRSERQFLYQVFGAVIKAGATVINIPDTVGYITPMEYYQLIRDVREHTPGIDKVTISTHCHDDLGLAVANSMAAIQAGAGQVECTINGIGERAGNAALEEIVMALQTRQDIYQQTSQVVTTELARTSQLLQSITGVKVQPNKAIVGANAFAHEAGIHQHGVLAEKSTYEIMSPETIGLQQNQMVLGKHSGKHALKDRLNHLGYSISEDELQALFGRFKELADEKKTVYDQDIEALMLESMSTLRKQYRLLDYSTATSQGKESKTIIKLADGEVVEEVVGSGSGPIDAAFAALDKIFGQTGVLEDFSIYSVTRGKDALGETVLKIRQDDRLYIGKGLSNDIIKSSILAYINAMNHLSHVRQRQAERDKQKGVKEWE